MQQKTIAIIVAFILGMGLLSANAQNKKVYQADATTKLSVQVNVTSGQLQTYLFVLQKGGPQALSQSKDMSAYDVTQTIAVYQIVTDSVNLSGFRAYNQFYKVGEAKWAADTLKAFKQAKIDPIKPVTPIKH